MRFFKIVLFLLLWLTVSPLFGQTIPLAGSLYSYWDKASYVAIQGDYAYVSARNQYLYTFDISEVERPRLLNMDYVGGGSPLKVIKNNLWMLGRCYAAFKLDDPAHPELTTSYFPCDIWDASAVTDGDLLVCNWDASIEDRFGQYDYKHFRIANVSDIENPRVYYNQENRFYETSYVLKDSLLWCGMPLRSVSLAVPAEPRVIANSQLRVGPVGMNDRGNVLYGWSYMDDTTKFCAIDVSNQREPHIVSAFPFTATMRDCIVQDSLVTYLSERYDQWNSERLVVINYARPDSAVEILNQRIVTGALSLGVGDSLLGIVDTSGSVNFYNHRNPAECDFVYALNNSSSIDAVAVVGDRAFVADRKRGLLIVDINDIHRPVELGLLELPAIIKSISATQNDRVYIVTADSGVFICEADDPRSPSIIGRMAVGNEIGKTMADGDYFYFIESSRNLRMLDCRDPMNISSWMMQEVRSFGKIDDELYTLTANTAVVYNVSEPDQPVERRRIALPEVRGQYYSVYDLYPTTHGLYYLSWGGYFVEPGVSGAWLDLTKTDIRNGDSARTISSFRIAEGEGPGVDGKILDYQDNKWLIKRYQSVFTIREESNSFNSSPSLERSENITGGVFAGMNVVLARGHSLGIYDCSNYLTVATKSPATPSLIGISAYPNPFNGQVKLNYTLRQMGLVEIEVFDAIGRQVATLPQGYQIAGSHALNWDANRLPSGKYNVVLTQKDNRSVYPIVLSK